MINTKGHKLDKIKDNKKFKKEVIYTWSLGIRRFTNIESTKENDYGN